MISTLTITSPHFTGPKHPSAETSCNVSVNVPGEFQVCVNKSISPFCSSVTPIFQIYVDPGFAVESTQYCFSAPTHTFSGTTNCPTTLKALNSTNAIKSIYRLRLC